MNWRGLFCARTHFCWLPVALFIAVQCLSQTSPSDCDSAPLLNCSSSSQNSSAGVPGVQFADSFPASQAAPGITRSNAINPNTTASSNDARPGTANPFLVSDQNPKQSFHWHRALVESFLFFTLEQAYVIHDDFPWVVSENDIPLNHYWRDYMQSLHTELNVKWNDGETPLYNYVGHPIQGAMTGYIQIQNDPKSWGLEFSNTKQYWVSRLKGAAWAAVYSAEWSIGPLSEMTIEKYGTQKRSSWNPNGTWPCTGKVCYTGVGQVHLVVTPVGGFVWIVGEDWLDKNLVRRVEQHTNNHFLIDTVRCALNPVRSGANALHDKRFWYRPRDTHGPDIARDSTNPVPAKLEGDH
jgi:hypothetical protein